MKEEVNKDAQELSRETVLKEYSLPLTLTWKKLHNLHWTSTRTVRLKGAPTPLSAVQRYVLFVFLCILLVAYFPSTTGSRGSLSVPSSFTLVQVMFGGGMPVALQLKKIKEPSQTTWSLLTLAIPGGTGKRRNTSSDLFPTLHCRRIFSLNPVVHALTNRRL